MRALRIVAAIRWPSVVVPALYEALDLVTSQWLLSVWAGILSTDCCLSVWAQMVRPSSQTGPSQASRLSLPASSRTHIPTRTTLPHPNSS